MGETSVGGGTRRRRAAWAAEVGEMDVGECAAS